MREKDVIVTSQGLPRNVNGDNNEEKGEVIGRRISLACDPPNTKREQKSKREKPKEKVKARAKEILHNSY